MPESRENDLVLTPNEFVYVSNSNTGLIKPVVGPTKKTLDSTEMCMLYDPTSRRFNKAPASQAIQLFPIANERAYLVVTNPASEEVKDHPAKGDDNTPPQLRNGSKKIYRGPTTFPLWPGQEVNVIEGHQLRSNQYLVCVVENADEATRNWKLAVIDRIAKPDVITEDAPETKFITGQILIIKGTDVSYFIPPTGISVIPDNKSFVREAVTLERLEYCILLDETGNKRYEIGPKVVFPEPTEKFIEVNGEKKFVAVELNDTMGLYVKVTADYEEGGKKYKAGDELFITGKEQRIYYPRSEHSIIKYGKKTKHYAIAVPKGEGRYVLDKDEGHINTVCGPAMYLPDPRKEVVVNRVLSEKEVRLWFPGNQQALEHNLKLAQQTTKPTDFLYSNVDRQAPLAESAMSMLATRSSKSSRDISDVYGDHQIAGDSTPRGETFTPPRSITLDTKYDGAVRINVWPGYAVQVVSKTGERKVVTGPKAIILDYDQTLECLELSTGKPKSDHELIKTAYLRIVNNRVSDIIEATSQDLVDVEIRVNYRLDFVDDENKWFSVENYVKFLTQNIRSLVRARIADVGIREFSVSPTNVIKDTVLGLMEEKTGIRKGLKFPENGMFVYDVEVLSFEIKDPVIKGELLKAQRDVMSSILKVNAKKTELVTVESIEDCEQMISKKRTETKFLSGKLELELQQQAAKRQIDSQEGIRAIMVIKSQIAILEREMHALDSTLEIETEKQKLEIRTGAFEKRFGAITPKLIEAMQASGNQNLLKAFVENIPKTKDGVGLLIGEKLIDNLTSLVKGTPMESALRNLATNKENLNS